MIVVLTSASLLRPSQFLHSKIYLKMYDSKKLVMGSLYCTFNITVSRSIRIRQTGDRNQDRSEESRGRKDRRNEISW